MVFDAKEPFVISDDPERRQLLFAVRMFMVLHEDGELSTEEYYESRDKARRQCHIDGYTEMGYDLERVFGLEGGWHFSTAAKSDSGHARVCPLSSGCIRLFFRTLFPSAGQRRSCRSGFRLHEAAFR